MARDRAALLADTGLTVARCFWLRHGNMFWGHLPCGDFRDALGGAGVPRWDAGLPIWG